MYYLVLLLVIFVIKQRPHIRLLFIELISRAKRLIGFNEAIYPDNVIELSFRKQNEFRHKYDLDLFAIFGHTYIHLQYKRDDTPWKILNKAFFAVNDE